MKFVFALIIFVNFINFSYASNLLSHKAYYTLILDKTKTSSILEGGSGKSTYLFNKGCNGWSLKENFMILYNLTNKKNAKSYSIFKSFEDFSSKNFSFEHFDKSDLSGEINYSGFVKKDGKNLKGSLIDIDVKKISFKGEILFPNEHMIKLINNAKKENSFFNSNVFFGSSKNNLIKKVSAFIGKKKSTSLKKNYKFLKKNVWPIKLAFYNFKQKKSSPETEISLELDEVGVVHNYLVNYGDYQMIGKLDKIDVLEEKKC